MKKKFEILERIVPETKEIEKALFVSGEIFDWGIKGGELDKAIKTVGNDPAMKKALYGDIQRYFLDSLAEFLGQTITLAEVNEAIEKGHIEIA